MREEERAGGAWGEGREGEEGRHPKGGGSERERECSGKSKEECTEERGREQGESAQRKAPRREQGSRAGGRVLRGERGEEGKGEEREMSGKSEEEGTEKRELRDREHALGRARRGAPRRGRGSWERGREL